MCLCVQMVSVWKVKGANVEIKSLAHTQLIQWLMMMMIPSPQPLNPLLPSALSLFRIIWLEISNDWSHEALFENQATHHACFCMHVSEAKGRLFETPSLDSSAQMYSANPFHWLPSFPSHHLMEVIGAFFVSRHPYDLTNLPTNAVHNMKMGQPQEEARAHRAP